uniref:C-Jun-amino-terminal kinase-interacting protein 4 n=1 Tax=Panagrellus redivivus TaxID=6233 RepID=A0A7E4ZXW9_PANRE
MATEHELALKDLYEVMSIAAAGYPPHLMDRYAEILENNDKALDELYEKKREVKKEMEIAQQNLDEALKDLAESLENMRLITLELEKLLKDAEDVESSISTDDNEKDVVEVNEMRIKELKEQIRLYELEMEKLRKGMEPSTLTNGVEEDAETD